MRAMATVGGRIKALRTARGLSQQALAVACGVAVSQVSRWERGESEPSLDSLRTLAHALQTSTDAIVGAGQTV
jgi:transcriptional regulator with XRE-family HTH domain